MNNFYIIATIAILGAISPGPDFIVVSKNAIFHSRKAGYLTSLGIGVGIVFHSIYCILGLALIISQSLLLFSSIRYAGAAYLIYLGIKGLLARNIHTQPIKMEHNKTMISNWAAFREGFLINVLNPKCVLFMLAIFTMVVKPHTSYPVQIIYALELSIIATAWFIFLSFILTHVYVKTKMNKIQNIVTKIMGAFLVFFGLDLIFKIL